MSTDLVKVSGGAVGAPIPQDDTGLDQVTKLSPTRMALVQPMTQDNQGAKIGQLLDTGTGLAYDEVTVVPFKFRYNRVFFAPGSQISKGNEPLCRSNDGNVPASDAKVKQANACASCHRAQWSNDGFKKVPPQCKEKIDLIVIDTNTDMPHFLSAGGISFAPFRKKLNGLLSLMNQDKKKGIESHPYHWSMTIGTEKDTKSANYKLIIKSIDRLVDSSKEFYTNMYNSFKAAAEAANEFAKSEESVDGAVGEVLEGELVQEV